MPRANPLLLLALSTLLLPLTANGQAPGARAWIGVMDRPTGPDLTLAYDVGSVGSRRLVITTTGPGRVYRMEAFGLVTSGSDLRFRFDPGAPSECTLAVPVRGGYEGECVDAQGRAGRLVIEPPVPGMLHPDHEAALAESAAPAAISASADLYVMTDTGFAKVRAGVNGFSCLVERPRIGDLWPVCYDPEGSGSMLPVSLARGWMRAAGVSEEAIADTIAAGYRSGRFRIARRNGVAYMVSTLGRSVNPSTGETGALGPHLMFYAPYVTREDIGQQPDADERMPAVMGSGRPDAYIIVRLPGYGPPGG